MPTTSALERTWALNDLQGVSIAEWPNYIFFSALRDGQRVFIQRSNESGTERQLRRIILMMS